MIAQFFSRSNRHYGLLGLSLVLSFLMHAAVAQQDLLKIHLQPLYEQQRLRHIAVTVTPKAGWHFYWRNPGDTGTAPIFRWGYDRHRFTLGQPIWPLPEVIPVAHLVNYGYSRKTTLLIPVTPIASGGPANIQLDAEWLVCEKECIPQFTSHTLTTTLIDPRGQELSAALHKRLQRPLLASEARISGKKLRLTLHGVPAAISQAYFFPATAEIAPSQKQRWRQQGDRLIITLPLASSRSPRQLSGLLRINDNAEGFQVSTKVTSTAAPLSWWWALVYAMLGGLILNLMPCVFPILSLKALALLECPKKVRPALLAAAFLGGVMLTFALLSGLLVFAKTLGYSVGWGIQLQSPLVVFSLSVLFFLLGLSLLGYFALPQVPIAGGLNTETQPVLGHFLTGLLAVIVATPCTAPFMGVALGFAFTQSAAMILLILLGLGFGFALPLTLLTLFPQWLRFLPRSGPWLIWFKELLGFPMLLTVVWLLWVYVHLTQWVALFPVMLLFITLSFAIWLQQKLAKRWSRNALVVVGLLAFAGTAYHATQLATPEMSQQATVADVRQAVQQGQAVFVNATAKWCITCKLNEQTTLHRAVTKRLFAKHDVRYLVLDWTQYDPSISAYLQEFDRQGVPLYVYYPKQRPPQILPQLLTPGLVRRALESKP